MDFSFSSIFVQLDVFSVAALLPSYIITVVVPCAILLLTTLTAIVIYVRIKTIKQAKVRVSFI